MSDLRAIYFTKKTAKQLDKFPKQVYFKLKKAINKLTLHPRPRNSKKLTDTQAYRLRVGDYRVIYQVRDQELIIIIIAIAHRKEAYK